jgi:hypothetical protein
MSQRDGFLSDEAAAAVSNARSQFGQWLKSYADLNRLGMKAMYKYGPTKELKRTYALALFVRCMQSLQGSYLLLERSMVTEARILLRSAAEAAIVLTALVADDAYVEKLDLRTDFYLKKVATDFLSDPALKSRIPQAAAEGYQQALNDIQKRYPTGFPEKSDPINIFDAAKCNQATRELYATVFRAASNDSTHISSGSLRSQFRRVENLGNVVAIGPTPDSLLSTLSQMFVVLHLSLGQILDIGGLHELDDEVAIIRTEWDARGFPVGATWHRRNPYTVANRNAC